jgi:type IV secretory pathway VirD2 relaxase
MTKYLKPTTGTSIDWNVRKSVKLFTTTFKDRNGQRRYNYDSTTTTMGRNPMMRVVARNHDDDNGNGKEPMMQEITAATT